MRFAELFSKKLNIFFLINCLFLFQLSKSTTRTDLGTFATQMENSANDGQTINPAKV